MKIHKACIFCNSVGKLTKEHLWPDWMSAYLPNDPSAKNISVVHEGAGKQQRTLVRENERPGAVHTRTLQAVCANCNNGWMSRLETEAKPVLLGLIQKDQTRLTSTAAATLAVWTAMKAIIFEHNVKGTALTPLVDRNALYTAHKIPDYMSIYVGYHTSPVEAFWRHSATLTTPDAKVPPLLPAGITRNTQSISLFIGPLFFYVTSVRIDGIKTDLLRGTDNLFQLWPKSLNEVDLTLMPIMTAGDVTWTMHSLERLIQHPRVGYRSS